MRRLITWRRGRDPEAGSVLVFWGVAIVVLLGMVALSFDVGRISATQSELQSYADNLAVAAAAELDGEATSIDRARQAAETLIKDSQTFAQGSRLLTTIDVDFRLDFFVRDSGMIGDTADADKNGTYSASEQASARYVRALVTPRDVSTPFTAVLGLITGNTINETTVSAQATAGMDEYGCKITPMFFCVPSGWNAEQKIGQMISLRGGSGQTKWGPGNFGFLDPSKLVELGLEIGEPCEKEKGSNLITCLIAAERPTESCFRQDGVDMDPGQSDGVNAAAFNVVFDIYHKGMKQDKDFLPAPNVTKGIKAKGGNKCIGNSIEATTALPLPRDDCLPNCATDFVLVRDDDGDIVYEDDGITPKKTYLGQFGDGTWSDTDYIAFNHDGDPRASFSVFPASSALYNTRYALYRAEIEAAKGGPILEGDGTDGSGVNEDGLPQCQTTKSDDFNRRVYIAAAIDCETNAVNGSAEGIPVQEFVRVFITEPVGYNAAGAFVDDNKFDLHVEVLGSAEIESEVGPAYVRKVVRLIE